MALLGRLLAALPLLILSPFILVLSVCALGITDLFWIILGRSLLRNSTRPPVKSASVVIPNWNGRDLLEKYLPSVVTALAGNPENEIVVVDNGSTDGSARIPARAFPTGDGAGAAAQSGFRRRIQRRIPRRAQTTSSSC